MTASLPMYWRAETAAANTRLWHLVRDAIGKGPRDLTHPTDLMAHWRDPALILSQTCGLPYRAALHDHVDLVGTPDFGLPTCKPGYYHSVLITRDEHRDTQAHDWAQMRLAINGPDSQSGWAAPHAYLAAQGYEFTQILLSGAHANSAEQVLDGQADIAAIDGQTWRMLHRWDTRMRALHVVGQTDQTPGLPLITAKGRGPLVREAVNSALAALSDADRHTLDLRGIVDIPAADYMALALPPDPKLSKR